MKVAFCTEPLRSAHKTRGIGYYTENLLEGLKQDKTIEVLEFTDLKEIKEADVVHYPWFDFYFHTLPIKKKFPTVVTIHDVIPLIFKKNYPVGIRGRLNFTLQKVSLKNCNSIITDSMASRKDINRYLNVSEEKIEVIPLASDQNFRVLQDTKLIQIRRKYNLPQKFLLYVGDANWVKNLPFLLEGFRKVCEMPQYSEVKLVLVGGVFLKNVENINHPELESLKELNKKIQEYNLSSRVIKPGNVTGDELVAFYNLATVYIQPSLYEGFGLPILQAFACGAPVISSDGGSLPEVGGDAAVYFPPTDLSRFKAILIDILEDKSLRQRLSELGLKQAEKFSWEKTVDKTKKIYQEAIK